MPEPIDISLKEFESVRAEIAEHQRTKTQHLALAVTATAAIGSFALGKNGNLDALFVLPIVLSGLAVVFLRHNIDIELLGQYVRLDLWPALTSQARANHDLRLLDQQQHVPWSLTPSWDVWIQDRRNQFGRRSMYGVMGVLPPLLVFGAPSAGALLFMFFGDAIGGSGMWTIWILDWLVVIAVVVLTVWVASKGPGWKTDPPPIGTAKQAAKVFLAAIAGGDQRTIVASLSKEAQEQLLAAVPDAGTVEQAVRLVFTKAKGRYLADGDIGSVTVEHGLFRIAYFHIDQERAKEGAFALCKHDGRWFVSDLDAFWFAASGPRSGPTTLAGTRANRRQRQGP